MIEEGSDGFVQRIEIPGAREMLQCVVHPSGATQRETQGLLSLRGIRPQVHDSLQFAARLVEIFRHVHGVQPAGELHVRGLRVQRGRALQRFPGGCAILRSRGIKETLRVDPRKKGIGIRVIRVQPQRFLKQPLGLDQAVFVAGDGLPNKAPPRASNGRRRRRCS